MYSYIHAHAHMYTHVHAHPCTYTHTCAYTPAAGSSSAPTRTVCQTPAESAGGGGRGLRRDQGAQPTLLFRSTQSNRGGKTHSAPQTSREPPRAGFSIGAEGEQEGEKEPHLGRQQSWLKERQDFPWGGGGWTGSDPEGTFSDARSRPVLEKR